ncbi:MAG TPA: hypothetical protein VFY64_01250 [Nitrososphaeraceae archaeon]|nr:hypothetical protein [Nitrososphaeraceae archaeon]
MDNRKAVNYSNMRLSELLPLLQWQLNMIKPTDISSNNFKYRELNAPSSSG